MESYASHSSHGDFERFWLLQEAILAPTYGKGDCLEELLVPRHQAEFVAIRAGSSSEVGRTIYDDADAFIKGVQDYWSKMTRTVLFSSLAVAAVALVAAAPIAGFIGGLGGLGGAPAYCHGLALLGGGSLAAGGLGMAGGMTTLGVGDGLLGSAIDGKGVAVVLGRLPKESVAITMCKVVNYVKYLATRSGPDATRAKTIGGTVLEAFLVTKHGLERDLLVGQVAGLDTIKATENIRILNFTYMRLAEISSSASLH